jgi:hypothetical protein
LRSYNIDLLKFLNPDTLNHVNYER